MKSCWADTYVRDFLVTIGPKLWEMKDDGTPESVKTPDEVNYLSLNT